MAGNTPAPGSAMRNALANLVAWLSLVARPRRVPPSRLLPPARRLAIGVAVGIVLVALAMAFLDMRAVMFARTLPRVVVDTFNEITDFGKSNWFLIPIASLIVLAAILSASMSRLANLVIVSLVVRLQFIFLAIAVPSLFVTIVKRLIGRLRPSDAGPFVYQPLSWSPAYASMPSGHETTAAAAAVAIGAVWPAARVPMWIYAVVIAMSRVIITAHFVSDVIAAAFVGAFGAILVRNWFAARRLAFTVGTDGTVRARPGPSWRRLKSVAGRLLRR